MNKYEAMIIVKPDLNDEEKKSVAAQISEAVVKHKGEVANLTLWSEKKKMYFPIKKFTDGVYYLMNFQAPSGAVADLKNTYSLNEFILRVLITKA